jgi:hypothetical protein
MPVSGPEVLRGRTEQPWQPCQPGKFWVSGGRGGFEIGKDQTSSFLSKSMILKSCTRVDLAKSAKQDASIQNRQSTRQSTRTQPVTEFGSTVQEACTDPPAGLRWPRRKCIQPSLSNGRLERWRNLQLLDRSIAERWLARRIFLFLNRFRRAPQVVLQPLVGELTSQIILHGRSGLELEERRAIKVPEQRLPTPWWLRADEQIVGNASGFVTNPWGTGARRRRPSSTFCCGTSRC